MVSTTDYTDLRTVRLVPTVPTGTDWYRLVPTGTDCIEPIERTDCTKRTEFQRSERTDCTEC